MEFDYDSSDGVTKKTHRVYIESDGLYFDGTIFGTASAIGADDGITNEPSVSADSSGLAIGDFEFSSQAISFGSKKLFTRADGSAIVFSGTLGCALDSSDVFGQGSTSGFTSGGSLSPPATWYSTIDKFPFSISSGTATDVGDLTETKSSLAGHSSSTDGFTSGGYAPGDTVGEVKIEKFPFSISSGTATHFSDLTTTKMECTGHSSATDGFTSGGNSPLTNSAENRISTIEKFSFSIGGTAVDVGDLSDLTTHLGGVGQQSQTDAFITGGMGGIGAIVGDIKKFPFSIVRGRSTTVGTLGVSIIARAGAQSSSTDGFISGGSTAFPANPGETDHISKFPFSIISGTTTSVGALSSGTGSRYNLASHSSTTDGFASGGKNASAAELTDIDKFPFSISSGNATDVGDLSEARTLLAGHQD